MYVYNFKPIEDRVIHQKTSRSGLECSRLGIGLFGGTPAGNLRATHHHV